eukprot:gnl/TRDRNA2_/TRDRNA2_163957_c2_seq2.p1 gnl/TRDRNA2_/TRDRNA2_163957_c2~~gnl/TRDRNA2_/TRDRNA2_163957_c2_seq2.p1  ORF type:complete len:516 (-),score=111.45 gnl/TRDRNA2_/TRDRNA2_163957_c2_seq2:99-1646(-)
MATALREHERPPGLDGYQYLIDPAASANAHAKTAIDRIRRSDHGEGFARSSRSRTPRCEKSPASQKGDFEKIREAREEEWRREEEGDDYEDDDEEDSEDDEIVHFEWQKGMVLHSRYEVLDLLGDGTFGRVLLARDRHKKIPDGPEGAQGECEVGIKIIRDVAKYRDDALIEADILSSIRDADVHRTSRVAMMLDTFMHDGNKHFCLVFEALGASLYDFLKKNRFRGFWMQDIHCMAFEMMQALAFLHQVLRMTHTDLKLENILLETREPPRPSDFLREAHWIDVHQPLGRAGQYLRPHNSRVKLIDFGNATCEDQHHSSIISTRQYRGPEVVLGIGWDEKSDIWSTGCILMELYTGRLLFGTHDDLEHLVLIQNTIGWPIPQRMLVKAQERDRREYVAQEEKREHAYTTTASIAEQLKAKMFKNQQDPPSMDEPSPPPPRQKATAAPPSSRRRQDYGENAPAGDREPRGQPDQKLKCGECGRGKPLKLFADPSDGQTYCRMCWMEFYGKDPPGK